MRSWLEKGYLRKTTLVSANTGVAGGHHVWSHIEALFPEEEIQAFSFQKAGSELLTRALKAVKVVGKKRKIEQTATSGESRTAEVAQVAQVSVDDKENPPMVNDPWQSVWDEGQQRYYFYNSHTRTSSWSLPE